MSKSNLNSTPSETVRPVRLSQVLTSFFVLIGSFAVGVLGMLENFSIIAIIPCFMISIFYSYASVKNLMEYKLSKKSSS